MDMPVDIMHGAFRDFLIPGIPLLGLGMPFASMYQREVLAAGGATFSDTMHIALGAATQVFYLLALGFAASGLWKDFHVYSIVTFVILFFFVILTFFEAPKVSVNAPTPLIGVWERINTGVFLLWVVVLAIVILRTNKQPVSIKSSDA